MNKMSAQPQNSGTDTNTANNAPGSQISKKARPFGISNEKYELLLQLGRK